MPIVEKGHSFGGTRGAAITKTRFVRCTLLYNIGLSAPEALSIKLQLRRKRISYLALRSDADTLVRYLSRGSRLYALLYSIGSRSDFESAAML